MAESIESEIVANVWKVLVTEGDAIAAGDSVMILESMKMEIPVETESGGTVSAVHVSEGAQVAEGDALVTIE